MISPGKFGSTFRDYIVEHFILIIKDRATYYQARPTDITDKSHFFIRKHLQIQ